MQIIISAFCFVLSFFLFFGVVVLWNPMALEKKQAKAQIVGSAVEMGDVDYWIKDPSYYSLDWYNNPAEGVGDSPDNPYLISS